MTPGLDALAGWTPVALHLDPPAIDWCDMTGERFAEPFFDQTANRFAAAGRALVRTDLDTLLALDAAPALEPCGIVLHLSRCGSTLVSRLLATLPDMLVVAEPAPLNTLLLADPARLDPVVAVRVLRLLVRALGRVRLGTERHFVLKLSSWTVRRLDLLRQAFPTVPLLWVQRRPDAVMASLLAEPPGWLGLAERPDTAGELFGFAPEPRLDATGFCAAALHAMLVSAQASDAAVIDYDDLPTAVWTRVAPHFGLKIDAPAIERMRLEAGFSAKLPGRIRFDPARARPVAPAIAAASAPLMPLYRALDRRRASGGEATRCSS